MHRISHSNIVWVSRSNSIEDYGYGHMKDFFIDFHFMTRIPSSLLIASCQSNLCETIRYIWYCFSNICQTLNAASNLNSFLQALCHHNIKFIYCPFLYSIYYYAFFIQQLIVINFLSIGPQHQTHNDIKPTYTVRKNVYTRSWLFNRF